MNKTDYDKTKFVADSHGNLLPKTKQMYYRGYNLDAGTGNVKVWAAIDGSFVCDFPDVQSAKEHIDALK